MNKKQIAVLWVGGMLLILAFILSTYEISYHSGGPSVLDELQKGWHAQERHHPLSILPKLIRYVPTILILTGLLFVSFKDSKKIPLGEKLKDSVKKKEKYPVLMLTAKDTAYFLKEFLEDQFTNLRIYTIKNVGEGTVWSSAMILTLVIAESHILGQLDPMIVKLLGKIKLSNPNTKIFISSDNPADREPQSDLNRLGVDCFFDKPINLEALGVKITELYGN